MNYLKNKILKNKYYVFLITAILIAYLPILSMGFALKNDFFTQYFPQRFFISESIHNGHFPLWNPYINYGIPIYGDMNAGFWYPITWLFAFLLKYNAYTFTIEALLHICIAGIGMYELLYYYNSDKKSSLLGAFAYACSGYIVGHLQHFNWITAATWLPFCLLYLDKFLNKPSLKSLCICCLIITLFLTSSHPGLIIGGFYFFTFIVFSDWIAAKRGKNHLKTIFKLILGIALCSIGTIIGYSEIIPLFSRSDSFTTTVLQTHALSFESLISLITPLPYTKINEEISLQNWHIGLINFIALIIGLINIRKNNKNIFLFIGIVFLVLSTRSFLSVFFQKYIPLLSHIRLSPELRIFSIFSFILFSSISLKNIINKEIKLFKSLILLTTIILSICIISNSSSLNELLESALSIHEIKDIKLILDKLTFKQMLFIQACTITPICTIILFSKINVKKVLLIGIIEILISTWLQLPFTGVGTRSVSNIQKLFEESPKGFPNLILEPEEKITRKYPETTLIIGDWSLYSKQIGIKKYYPYPILLQNSKSFFEKYENNVLLKKQPFIGIDMANTIVDKIRTTPTEINFDIENKNQTLFFIKQNQYPGWKLYVNGILQPPKAIYSAFPSCKLNKGKYSIKYTFQKPVIIFLFFLQTILCLIIIVIIASNTFFHNRS